MLRSCNKWKTRTCPRIGIGNLVSVKESAVALITFDIWNFRNLFHGMERLAGRVVNAPFTVRETVNPIFTRETYISGPLAEMVIL